MSSSQRNTNKTIDVVCKSEICTYLPGSSDTLAMGRRLMAMPIAKSNSS